jgi:hypothetical protein
MLLLLSAFGDRDFCALQGDKNFAENFLCTVKTNSVERSPRAVAIAGLVAIPAPIERPAPVFRADLPGIDVGADAWPAQPGRAAYVEIWAYPHSAGDVATLLQWPIGDAPP